MLTIFAGDRAASRYWGIPNLALQQRMGLLPKRWFGSSADHHHHFATHSLSGGLPHKLKL
jgi:hypothetical protein